MNPTRAPNKNPLVVFLLSAGGNAEKELEGNVKLITGYGDEFVGLALNSPSNLATPVDGFADYDWWWGLRPSKSILNSIKIK